MLRDASGPAVSGELVLNPVDFDEENARVWILTGPNRGGKTVYACSVGQAQVLFQAGLYVPARSARLSPVDAIFTHFPTPERAQPGMGRLDEEAARLSAIFGQAGPNSLILLNEVLAGTNGIEGLAMAHDVVRGLRLLGGRAIYVTHLHELAGQADEINAHTAGEGKVGSLVSEVEVDALTGEHRVRRVDVLHDCGDSINPAVDRGQVEGGFVQGMGWVTTEELWWDAQGRLRTSAPSTYKIPTSSDVPEDFRVTLRRSPNREPTVHRSTAVGAPPLMLAISVFQALRDAVAAAGDYRAAPRLDAPATPERVLLAVEELRARLAAEPAPEQTA
jgi:hypothetical protein